MIPSNSNPHPKAVIFDCDGVLVDSERLELGVMIDAFGWLGLDADPQALLERRRGGSHALLLDDIVQLLGRPLPEGFGDRYRARQLEGLKDVEVVPGAPEAIALVPGAKAVASGGPMEKMDITLAATGLRQHFGQHVYSCYDLGSHKPDPQIYLHTARQLGVAPKECVVIEDSVTGVTAAAAAGMWVIGLARDVEPHHLEAAGAATTVDHMAAVPNTWGSIPHS